MGGDLVGVQVSGLSAECGWWYQSWDAYPAVQHTMGYAELSSGRMSPGGMHCKEHELGRIWEASLWRGLQLGWVQWSRECHLRGEPSPTTQFKPLPLYTSYAPSLPHCSPWHLDHATYY